MAEKKSIISEFKEFISRGNVIDLAVGVIIGSAFTAIVNYAVLVFVSPSVDIDACKIHKAHHVASDIYTLDILASGNFVVDDILNMLFIPVREHILIQRSITRCGIEGDGLAYVVKD